MSVVDTATKVFAGSSSETSLTQIVQMLVTHEGGTDGLVKTFQTKGLGGIFSSWLGSGNNLPISADQIRSVFGNERIAGLATKLGISPDVASQKAAEILPVVIDKLSPNGTLPASGDLMAQAGSLLKSFLAKNA